MLLKIEKLRFIAELNNATGIGISESKFADSMLTSEIQINEYNLIRCEKNRHGGRVVSYNGNDLGYNIKSYFLLTSLTSLSPAPPSLTMFWQILLILQHKEEY